MIKNLSFQKIKWERALAKLMNLIVEPILS